MANVCIICNHPKRLQIDREIVQGKNLSKIAKEYEVPYHSIYLHAQKHISRQLSKVMDTKMMIEGNQLMETITRIIERAEDIFTRNYKSGKDGTALKALDSQRNTIQLLSNISAQLHAAKIAELQLQKEASGNTKEEQDREFQKKLQVLSTDELAVFERLISKVENQTDNKIISGNRVLPNVIERGYN